LRTNAVGNSMMSRALEFPAAVLRCYFLFSWYGASTVPVL